MYTWTPESLAILLLVVGSLLPLMQGQQDLVALYKNMHVRLVDENAPRDRIVKAGRIEVSTDFGQTWGTICSTVWSMREGNVVCRQLGLGYAADSRLSQKYGNSRQNKWSLVGTLCRGNERRLSDCMREKSYPSVCHPERNGDVATVECIGVSPDLRINVRMVETSHRLDITPMSRITCAMEENCVARDAYEIRRSNPEATRNLLRFAVAAENVGSADFSPYSNYREWEWHQCHQHFHSMKVFSTFDVYNKAYQKVAQGHKASFCLMDTTCLPGIRPKYTCGNQTQGISIGCADIYNTNLDCQWVDVTNLQPNYDYILRVALNPEYRIGEVSFENNAVECELRYTGVPQTTTIRNCKEEPLWSYKIYNPLIH